MTEKLLCRPFSILALIFAGAALTSQPVLAAFQEVAPGLRIQLSTSDPLEGGIVLVTLEADSSLKLDDLGATFDGKEIPFYELPEENHYGAVFGVNHDLKPGRAELVIHSGARRGVLSLNVVDGG